jgi:hypothetical protein
VNAGMEGSESREHLAVAPEELEGVISRSRAQTSIDRLEIYARAYYARLLECLRAEYPVMVMAMGEELFDQFGVAYLQQYPSRSYTLDGLGADFANYLVETRRAVGDDGDAWLDFLADLAQLEWNIADVFDGLGVEGQDLLGLDELTAMSADAWPAARLEPVPCLRLLRLDFPMDDYYRDLRAGLAPAPPDASETLLAISRRDYVVRHFRLSGAQHAILAALMAGEPVGDAVMRGAALVSDEQLDALAADLQKWFRQWAAEGFFLRVREDSSANI